MAMDAKEFPLDDTYWQSLLNDVEAMSEEEFELQEPGRPAVNGARHDDQDALWAAAQRAYESGEIIEVESTNSNRGGLLIDWRGLRGFMPASQIAGLAPTLDEENRRLELMRRIGLGMRAKVIECDRAQGRFVVSERATNVDEVRREALWRELAVQQIRRGLVTNVCSFGAFVDLGGIEGLLHISEISWGRVGHPGDLLQIGQDVQVLIVSVDRDQQRVALSMKRLLPDPWATVEQRYAVGQEVEGIVTGVVNFGAFARLEEGLEGLIHVSELAEGNFLHPRNVVHEGDTVRVRILNIDGAHRRLGLSLRQVNGTGDETDAPIYD
jgi:small subunit ribosomal protein S1